MVCGGGVKYLVCVATARGEKPEELAHQLLAESVATDSSTQSPVEKYEAFYQDHGNHGNNDVLHYLHSDLTIYEPCWQDRILAEFADPKVAIVGFGGAMSLGRPHIYKEPYFIWNLARGSYFSNQRDWAAHGTHEPHARDVAVVDGFAMSIRTDFLHSIFGWKQVLKVTHFHCYDLAICCLARRGGWKVRMVGIDCLHRGGGTSTSPEYEKWCEEHGTDMGREHAEPHVRLYKEFKDVLPFHVHAL
jgi:hypothetical protein